MDYKTVENCSRSESSTDNDIEFDYIYQNFVEAFDPPALQDVPDPNLLTEALHALSHHFINLNSAEETVDANRLQGYDILPRLITLLTLFPDLPQLALTALDCLRILNENTCFKGEFLSILESISFYDAIPGLLSYQNYDILNSLCAFSAEILKDRPSNEQIPLIQILDFPALASIIHDTQIYAITGSVAELCSTVVDAELPGDVLNAIYQICTDYLIDSNNMAKKYSCWTLTTLILRYGTQIPNLGLLNSPLERALTIQDSALQHAVIVTLGTLSIVMQTIHKLDVSVFIELFAVPDQQMVSAAVWTMANYFCAIGHEYSDEEKVNALYHVSLLILQGPFAVVPHAAKTFTAVLRHIRVEADLVLAEKMDVFDICARLIDTSEAECIQEAFIIFDRMQQSAQQQDWMPVFIEQAGCSGLFDMHSSIQDANNDQLMELYLAKLAELFGQQEEGVSKPPAEPTG